MVSVLPDDVRDSGWGRAQGLPSGWVLALVIDVVGPIVRQQIANMVMEQKGKQDEEAKDYSFSAAVEWALGALQSVEETKPAGFRAVGGGDYDKSLHCDW